MDSTFQSQPAQQQVSPAASQQCGVLFEGVTILHLTRYPEKINIKSKEISHVDIISRIIPNRGVLYTMSIHSNCEDGYIDLKCEVGVINLTYIDNTNIVEPNDLYCYIFYF